MSDIKKQHTFSIIDATLVELHHAMNSGALTSRELVQTYLSRIDRYDRKGPKLQSVIAVNRHALEQADSMDIERWRQGPRGYLHGIPIVVKDNYNTKEIPTTGGIKKLAHFVPNDDCPIVQYLKKAGAIVLGKTNLHELSLFGLTFSEYGGQTRNPYDLNKTPGGSSGGTAAAVSANFAAVGLGTDTVNSVRSPASANNLVGIRPTKGLVNLEGIIPVSFTQDNAGPIARTVEDAAILLEAMTENRYSFSSGLSQDGLRGTRIGVLHSFFGKSQVHEDVNRVTHDALQQMEELGATVINLPMITLHADQLLEECDVQRFELRYELERYFTSYNAPIQTIAELLENGSYLESTVQMIKSAMSIVDPLYDPEYKQRLKKIEALRGRVLNLLDEYQLDTLLYPHQKRLVVDIGSDAQVDRNGILASLTGLPAITFQAGFSTPTSTADIGIPIGIEFLGQPYGEAQIIRMAYAFERSANHRRIPPTVGWQE